MASTCSTTRSGAGLRHSLRAHSAIRHRGQAQRAGPPRRARRAQHPLHRPHRRAPWPARRIVAVWRPLGRAAG
eukprot:8037607-Alexandrium_andersonii.AAC.1